MFVILLLTVIVLFCNYRKSKASSAGESVDFEDLYVCFFLACFNYVSLSITLSVPVCPSVCVTIRCLRGS